MQEKRQHIPAEELRAQARRSFEEAKRQRGLTQQELAKGIGVAQATVSQALSEKADRPFTDLLVKIIEHCGPYKVKGPLYQITRTDTA